MLITLIIGVITVKIVSSMLKKWMLKAKINEILAEFATRIIRLLMYIFVLGASLVFVNIYLFAALAGLSTVTGFVLGFALSETLGSIAAGFMLAITKPFKKGDYVEVSGEAGVVKNVGISVTEIDTVDNKHVVIPNKAVWGSNIKNYTHNPTRRVDMTIGVSYSDDLDKVIKTTMDLLKKDKRVLKDPAPMVGVDEMADSSVNLVIRPWVKSEDYWGFYFDFNKILKQTYDKEKISIPFPQMDIHMQK